MEIHVHGDDKYGDTVSELFDNYDDLVSYLKDEHGQIWYHPNDQKRIVKELKAKGLSDWEGNIGYVEFEVVNK